MGKLGGQIHDYANGPDRERVRSRHTPEAVKSVGNGTTFPKNLTTRAQVAAGVRLLSDSVAGRLRRAGLYAGGVHVTVRDPAFHDRSRQRQLAVPTHLIRDISAAALELAEELWKPPNPVRALTVTAIHLTPEGETYEQEDLFAAGSASNRPPWTASGKNMAAEPSPLADGRRRTRRTGGASEGKGEFSLTGRECMI